MSWFHRGVIGFLGFIGLLWLGQVISSTLSLCRTSVPLASPLFLVEASRSRYHAPFLIVLFVGWLLMSGAEAYFKKEPLKAYLQRNLHGVFALLVWLAFPLYKLLYLFLWGLFATMQRRRPQWVLSVFFTVALVFNPQLAWACQPPPMLSTALNIQKLKHMLSTYRASEGHYPSHWQALKQKRRARPDAKPLRNPYQPETPAVIDYASLSQAQKVLSPETPLAHRYTDIAGFRLYHHWWRTPISLPRDQGIVVYHYQSPEDYRLYILAHTGQLMVLPDR